MENGYILSGETDGTGAFSEYILKHNINKNIHLEMLDNDKTRLEYLKKKLMSLF